MKPSIIAYIIEHWGTISLTIAGLYETIMTLYPTVKKWTILNLVVWILTHMNDFINVKKTVK